MTKSLSYLGYFLLVLLVPFVCLAFTACGEPTSGQFTENGVTYNVENFTATVIDFESGATEATVAAEIQGADVMAIKTDAFKDSTITTLTFAPELAGTSLMIEENAFSNSAIKNIVNLPADTILDIDAFADMQNLESITVNGTGELSIENGALVRTTGTETVFVLQPASTAPQTNFEVGTLTLTGYDRFMQNSFAYNKFVTDVIINPDVVRVSDDAFKGVTVSTITFAEVDRYEVTEVESLAFEINKNVKIFVPATNDNEIDSWINYSNSLIEAYAWIVHPTGCSNDNPQHVHEVPTAVMSASFEGISYTLNSTGTAASFGNVMNWSLPSYMR